MQKLKKDNQGFSLVELLIAMLILGVIVAPMLRAFVMSARMNRIARNNLNEAVVAENIMEGLKSHTVEEIDSQFASYDASVFDIINPSDILGNVSCISSGDLEKEYKIENINQGEGFDARIILNAKPYVTDPSGGAAATVKLNSMKVISVNSVNAKGNVAYMEPDPGEEPNVFTESSNIKRDITISIEKLGEGATVEYNYKYSPYGVISPSVSLPDEYTSAKMPYTPGCNIYLFYRPFYSGASAHETITIKNSDKIDANVYIVKQETTTNLVLLSKNENLYRVNLLVNESAAASASTKTPEATQILTNINSNLAAQYDTSAVKELSSVIANNTTAPEFSSLLNEIEKNRYYDVKITIYKHSEPGTEVYEVTGNVQN